MMRALRLLLTLLSHWRKHPLQLATLFVGLISATALWSGVQALNAQARDSYDRAAAALGGARTASLVGPSETFPQQFFVDLRRAGWPVSPLIEGRIQIGGRSIRLLGIEPVTLPREAVAAPALGVSGLQDFLTPPGRTLVAPETLRDLGVTDGATLRINDDRPLPPLRAQPQLAPGVLIVDIGIAQRALGKPDAISRLLIDPKATATLPPLAAIVGDRLHRVEPDAETDIARLTDSFHLNLTAFGLLSFLVGLFIVNSAIGLAFEQRRPMLRTLRACGASARMLNAVLLSELIGLALTAGIIGLGCGYLIAAALLPDVAVSLRGLYGAQVPGELTLRPSWWIAGLAISVIGAVGAGTASLIKATRLGILPAAQPYAWQQAQQRWLRRQALLAAAAFASAAAGVAFGTSLAAAFAVLALLLLGAALALPAILAALLRVGENAARNPLGQWFFADSRLQLSGLSLALMALLMALAVNVGVGTMVESFSRTFNGWLDGRLAAEIYLNAADDAQANDIKSFLRERPQVRAVLPGGRAEIRYRGDPLDMLGFADDATYRASWPFLESTRDAWDRVAQGSGALISEQLARRQRLRLGDRITVDTPQGAWPLDVVAIYADYGNPKGQIGVAFDALIAHFPQTPRTRFGLRVDPDRVAALVAELRARFALDERSLADQSVVKAESRRIFNRTFSVTTALNGFTLGIAAIALFTSLLTLSSARLPQIAPLWAIGVTRNRLAAIELMKTMAVALLTAMLALPLGLLVAWCLIALVNVRAFGWRLPFQVFPMQLVTLLAVAMAASLLAAALPLLKLLRTEPAALLRTFANER